ncbi:hypothetical protein [Oryza sativa Japonica Group]|uniref:Uncharacterized protein n=1 Tax=Oryza sativa subsp. japonica TaxID=39947 RepID=Q5ZD72_ORYSJ|nr:hypothetical protein [Oryza sativa Japonica Group]
MQPPSSSSQVSASALFQGVPARRPPLPAQAPPPPRFGADGPLRPAPLPRRRLPQPPYSSMQARESMGGHAPWETLNPLSYEAPGIDFSTAYSVCDEEFLHMSNFDPPRFGTSSSSNSPCTISTAEEINSSSPSDENSSNSIWRRVLRRLISSFCLPRCWSVYHRDEVQWRELMAGIEQ